MHYPRANFARVRASCVFAGWIKEIEILPHSGFRSFFLNRYSRPAFVKQLVHCTAPVTGGQFNQDQLDAGQNGIQSSIIQLNRQYFLWVAAVLDPKLCCWILFLRENSFFLLTVITLVMHTWTDDTSWDHDPSC